MLIFENPMKAIDYSPPTFVLVLGTACGVLDHAITVRLGPE